MWHTSDGRKVRHFDLSLESQEKITHSVCFNDKLVTVSESGNVEMWEYATDDRFTICTVDNFKKLVSRYTYY